MACARQEEPAPPPPARCPSRSSVDLFATQRDDDYQEEINMEEDEDEQVKDHSQMMSREERWMNE